MCGDTVALTWQRFDSTTLHMVVDTSICRFTAEPQYFVNLVELNSGHTHPFTRIECAASVTTSHQDHFTVTIAQTTADSKYGDLMQIAKSFKWRLSWIADTGSNTGVTVAGKTGWSMDGDTVWADVDTSGCHYPQTPHYFPTLRVQDPEAWKVDEGHWRVQGSNVVYNPTKSGFRLYLGSINGKSVTAAQAEKIGWVISWIGVLDKFTTGQDLVKWEPYERSGRLGGMHASVTTASSHFKARPTYVFSLHALTQDPSQGGRIAGSQVMFMPHVDGFQAYLGSKKHAIHTGEGAAHANEQKWAVVYVGLEPPDYPYAVEVYIRLTSESLAQFNDLKRQQLILGFSRTLRVSQAQVFIVHVQEFNDPLSLTFGMHIKAQGSDHAR
jgi:hypothetical protein